MNNIDAKLAGTPKPEWKIRHTFAIIMMFVLMPTLILWFIPAAYLMAYVGEVKEWERHQQLGAMMQGKETS